MNVLNLLFNFFVFPGFLFLAILGMFLTFLDRKLSARIQWRMGPPWYQPYLDFVKLLSKEIIIPVNSSKILFLFAPVLSFFSALISGTMIYYLLYPEKSFVGDIIVILYFLTLVPVGFVLGASASRNPLSACGAQREITLLISYEVPLLFALLIPIIKAGDKIKIGEIIMAQNNFPFLYSLSGIISFITLLFVFQAKLGYIPFDIAEAEQEIMGGIILEYSGAPLALFKLSKAMLLLSLPAFLISLLWPAKNIITFIVKFLIIFLLIVLIKNTNPRLRIDQALRFFWFILGPFSILGIILTLSGL
ncbi:MAG: NADH-quinone oxidoreductase subunit H [candidate division WOR-3 bacterium]|nr:NADH-quinone oxidoreductase subunit H [candidate division WOR-3 bacterium]